MIRVIVCGGRDYEDQARVDDVLDRLLRANHQMAIIHGACGWEGDDPSTWNLDKLQGADRLAAEWGYRNDQLVVTYPAYWKLYGKKAGPMRNVHMAVEARASLVVAFPGGRGTLSMRQAANQQHIPVLIIDPRVAR